MEKEAEGAVPAKPLPLKQLRLNFAIWTTEVYEALPSQVFLAGFRATGIAAAIEPTNWSPHLKAAHELIETGELWARLSPS